MPAEAGTYKAGQLLAVDATTGQVEEIAADLTTTPPYLCMADITVETAGTPHPRYPRKSGLHLRNHPGRGGHRRRCGD